MLSGGYAAIGIGYLGGHFLDHKLGTQPWLSYLGFLAGIGAAIKALVRVTRAYKREQGDGPDKDKGSDGRG